MLKARKCKTKSGIEKPPAGELHMSLQKNGFKLAQKQTNKQLQISKTQIAYFKWNLFIHSFAG
jgi:hypothetical protein